MKARGYSPIDVTQAYTTTVIRNIALRDQI